MDRKTLREGFATKIKAVTGLADTGTIAHVYDHLPKNLNGVSPVCTIESGPSLPNTVMDDDLPEKTGLIVGMWVRRDDAASAEDTLDQLLAGLVSVLRTNYNAEISQATMPDYEMVDGVEYRVEFFAIDFE